MSIGGFNGQAINVNVTPTADPGGEWSPKFAAAPYVPGQQYQYSIVMDFENGKTLSFDPFLKSQ